MLQYVVLQERKINSKNGIYSAVHSLCEHRVELCVCVVPVKRCTCEGGGALHIHGTCKLVSLGF